MGKDKKGKELGKGICQRKDGRYVYRYTDLYGNAKCEYFNTERGARRRLIDVEYEKEHYDITMENDMTLDEWFDYWIDYFLRDKSRKATTVELYIQIYNLYVKGKLGDCLMGDVTPIMCQKLLRGMLQNGYSQKTIDMTRTLIKTLYNHAIDFGMEVKNPITRFVKCEGGKTRETKALTVSEKEELIEAAEGSSGYNMLIVAFETGLRRSELAGLFWEDIDFQNGLLHVEMQYRGNAKTPYERESLKSKTSRRVVPLTERASNAFKRERDKAIRRGRAAPKDFVFKGRGGHPISQSYFWMCISRAEKKACARRIENGIAEPFPHVHPHTCRHTFATLCVQNGVEPAALQKIMGHSDISTTMGYYVHVDTDYLKAQMEKINLPENVTQYKKRNEINVQKAKKCSKNGTIVSNCVKNIAEKR